MNLRDSVVISTLSLTWTQEKGTVMATAPHEFRSQFRSFALGTPSLECGKHAMCFGKKLKGKRGFVCFCFTQFLRLFFASVCVDLACPVQKVPSQYADFGVAW